MLEITNWNISPNRDWFVKLSDTGTKILVQLYLTSSDASSGINLQAFGSSTGYGNDLEVILVDEVAAIYSISLFQEEYDYHLQVSGSFEDVTKIYKVAEFVELPDIQNSIYRSTDLITLRATTEINEHTHNKNIIDLQLGVHLLEIELGQIASILSTNRGVNALGQINFLSIEGGIGPNGNAFLLNSLEVIEFMEVTR